jgi:YD repeat-containing protein
VVVVATLLLGLVCWVPTAKAGEARYIYDDLGRLHQVIDENGDVATYTYDAVGNILSVTRSTGGVGAPTITGITPASGNAGQTVAVTLSGISLAGAAVSTNNSAITVSGVRTTATSLSASFAIAYGAATGVATVTVATSLVTQSGTVPIK